VRGKGRVKTKAYKAWISEAGWKLKTQKAVAISGPVTVDIAVSEAGGPEGEDLDNKAKAVLDLLTAHKVIEDDSKRFVRELNLRWVADIPEGVTIEIMALEPQAAGRAA
jgi:Holliday junction resolvase RusA-like endonuclease